MIINCCYFQQKNKKTLRSHQVWRIEINLNPQQLDDFLIIFHNGTNIISYPDFNSMINLSQNLSLKKQF